MANSQSYGDEAAGKDVLFPGHHATVGVEDADFHKERTPEQVLVCTCVRVCAGLASCLIVR